MKPKHISPQAQTQHKRSHGDAPALGRVQRIPGGDKRPKIRKRSSGGKSGLRRSKHMDHRARRLSEERHFRLKVWATLIALAVISAFSGGLYLWLKKQGGRQATAVSVELVRDAISPTAAAITVEPPTERKAQQIIEGAILSTNAATLHEFVHMTDEVGTGEMIGFFAGLEEEHGEIAQYQWIGTPEALHDHQMQVINVIFEKDFLRSMRVANLLPDRDGTWKLDFPSFARWSDPPLRLLESPVGYPGGRIRALIGRETYFNGIFSDDRKWACFVFVSPDVDVSGYGYVRSGSPLHLQLLDLLPTMETPPKRATFEVRRVEGSEIRQFEITRLIAGHWLAEEFVTEAGAR